jgi:hypothetical protein
MEIPQQGGGRHASSNNNNLVRISPPPSKKSKAFVTVLLLVVVRARIPTTHLEASVVDANASFAPAVTATRLGQGSPSKDDNIT